ncbi:hypothetical protein D3C87_1625670 [compost metagenome]
MNKTDWYANRILWRVGKLHLDDYLWSNFSLLNAQAARALLQAMEMGEREIPLVVFWKNNDKWTLLTNQYLRGRIDGAFNQVSLDDISDVSTVNNKNIPPNDFKHEAEYFLVGKDKKIFWTPMGSPHFSLRNILAVFPLNAPA